jgi:sulfate transport system ATP-binding protein
MSIVVKNITKSFDGVVAVDDVSFEVPNGALLALLGPSGCGKTTLLRIIAGLEVADRGSVLHEREDITSYSARDRQIGFVFQHYALFRHMTIEQNIGYGLQVRGVAEAERKARVDELLKLIRLDTHGSRYPAELSGGQRQRVALARALAAKPRVLLLDEPFGALDAKVRQELRQWLRRLHDEIHVTSVFVTHDQEEAFEVADRVVLMNGGRVEQMGSPGEIVDSPANAFVTEFVGDVNVLDGVVTDGAAVVGKLRVPVPELPEGTQTRVLVRVYDLKLWRDDDAGIATVDFVAALGDRVRVAARLDDGSVLNAQFPRRSSLLRGVEVGARVAVEVTLARIYRVEDGRPQPEAILARMGA